jgi:hypothetical protein
MAKKQAEILHLAPLETPRKEKAKPYPIGRKSGTGLCLEPKQNGRMGHRPEPYARNHHNRISAAAKRVYLNGGILSFKAVKLTNRRIRDPYVRWCERDKEGQLVFLTLLDYRQRSFLFYSFSILFLICAVDLKSENHSSCQQPTSK